MSRIFSAVGTLAALLLSVSASALTIDVTGYDALTDKVSFSFTGVERDLSLFALWDDGDKGPVPCAYAETWPMGTIAAGTTSASVALPAGLDASKGCVRFVLADLGGATPIRSLSSTGYQWVDTEIRPSKDATVTVVCRNAKGLTAFGIAKWCYLFYTGAGSSAGYYWGAGRSRGTCLNVAVEDNVKRKMTVSPAGAFVDGVDVCGTITTDSTKVAPDCALALFARRDLDDSSGVSTASRGPCTIFSAEVKEGDTRVGYVIPCLKDDVAQMYDMVNRRFLTNCGKGAFEVDRLVALNVSEPIDGLVAVSDVLRASVPSPARSIAVKSIDWSTGAVTLTVAKGRRTSYLYVARDIFDAGLLASIWSDVRALGEVAADATEATCTIPSDMLASEGVMRFFLSSQASSFVPVYDWLIPEGDVYVDTGYLPTNTDKVTLRIRSLDAETFKGGVFCARNISATQRFTALVQSADRKLRVDRMDNVSTGPALGYETDYDIVADYQSCKVTINGTSSFTLPAGAIQQISETLLLLAGHELNTGVPSNFGRMRLGHFKVEDADGIVRLDLRPTVKDGVACLYDAVSKRYLPNSGTGRFTVGQQVESLKVNPGLFKIESATSSLAVCQPKVSVKANAEQGRITIRLDAHNRAGRVFLAGGPRDCGSRLSDWPNWLLAGTVSAQENELVVDIPTAWKEAKCKVFRAFFATAESDLCAVAGLSGDGRAWIDTGLLPDEGSTFTIRAKVSGYKPMFGIVKWLYLFRNSTSLYWAYPGIPNLTGSSDPKGLDMTKAQTYRIGPEGASIGEMFLGASTVSGSRTTRPTCNMTIFGRATDIQDVASGMSDGDRAVGSVYWAKLERDGVLVSDLQPCKWKGEPCLYDRVRKIPLRNAIPESGAKFTVESATATPLDEEILSVSPVCSLTRGLVILFF